ncbi:hypothetical protein [Nonomuraea aurantiaca]|nr:hypothetical protein [Nonomuraea aurantiaca]
MIDFVMRLLTMLNSPTYLLTSARKVGAVTDSAATTVPVAPVSGMATLR